MQLGVLIFFLSHYICTIQSARISRSTAFLTSAHYVILNRIRDCLYLLSCSLGNAQTYIGVNIERRRCSLIAPPRSGKSNYIIARPTERHSALPVYSYVHIAITGSRNERPRVTPQPAQYKRHACSVKRSQAPRLGHLYIYHCDCVRRV